MTRPSLLELLDLQSVVDALQDFPALVQGKREQHELTLPALAELSGVTPAAIRTIEWRNRPATVIEAEALVRAIVAIENERRRPQPEPGEDYEPPSVRLERNLAAAGIVYDKERGNASK